MEAVAVRHRRVVELDLVDGPIVGYGEGTRARRFVVEYATITTYPDGAQDVSLSGREVSRHDKPYGDLVPLHWATDARAEVLALPLMSHDPFAVKP